jgi:two-component sensor histidine kinase
VLRASSYAPDYVGRCRLGRGLGLVGTAIVTGKELFISEGASKHPANVTYPGLDERHLEGVAVLPLRIEGRNVGVCLIHRESPWEHSDESMASLLDLADATAVAWAAVRGARLRANGVSRIDAVTEVSKTLTSSPYLEEVLQLLVNVTAQQFSYVVCTVRLLDAERGELVLRATQAPAKAYQRKRAIKLGESIAGKAIDENRPIIVPDVQVEPDYIGHELAVEQGLRSLICLPLTVLDRVVGVMSCYTGEVREFQQDEIAALESIAKQAAFSIEHAKLQVRTTLLQEMHHRVKNNLQQVASLLRIQMRHGQYKSLEEALNDSLSRILAISAVHELLGREDLDHVGVRTLAETLIHYQRDSLMLPDRHIAFQVRGDDVHLDTAQATQIALILNELIHNAVEHGFKRTTTGDVHVTVEQHESEVALWVSNNGDRLPDAFDLAKHGGLGLHIIESLCRALGGRFKLGEILGWAVAELRFTPQSLE